MSTWLRATGARPSFSAERFGAEGYRTGDRGRRRPDGTLLCLGRLDRQAKVRGQRVELGEVEDGLAALPGVARAVAVVAGERLVGYVRPGAGPRPEGEALRRELADRLPAYAVPDSIVVVDELPLTPSGKVQVQALTEPPATALERTVHDVWCDVLGLPAVGGGGPVFRPGRAFAAAGPGAAAAGRGRRPAGRPGGAVRAPDGPRAGAAAAGRHRAASRPGGRRGRGGRRRDRSGRDGLPVPGRRRRADVLGQPL